MKTRHSTLSLPLSLSPFGLRWTRWLLLLVLCHGGSLLQAEEWGQVGRVHRQGAVVRAEQGFGGPALAALALGEHCRFQAQATSEWLRVRLSNGEEGWLHELYVESVESSSIPARPVEFRAPPVQAAPVLDSREMEVLQGQVVRLRQDLEQREAELRDVETGREAAERRAERLAERVRQLESRTGSLEEVLAASREVSRLEAGEQAARSAATREARHQAELTQLKDGQTLALETLAAVHARAIQDLTARGGEELAAEVERSQSIGDTFIARCAHLHERELERLTVSLTADKEEALLTLQREHEKTLARVGKESGWEKDFKAAVKEAADQIVKDEVAEAVFRSKTRRRGERDAHERDLVRLTAQAEQACELATSEAVKTALAARETEEDARLQAARQSARSVCLRALEMALARGPEGIDPERIRDLRESWSGDGPDASEGRR